MRAIVTGANGTVGTALVRALERGGHTAIPWDRARVPIDHYDSMLAFVKDSGADALYHLAMPSKPTGRENEGWLVTHHWTSELAWIASVLGIPFVYSSTVMVWTDKVPGPLTVATLPDAPEGYGADKRIAEDRIRHQNPQARIARLGWQIGAAPGSNNMIDFFHQRMAAEGVVRASSRWLPSCSPVDDTAEALIRLVSMEPGLYLMNSNKDMTFHEIACSLARRHNGAWKVEETADFTCDQRMIDHRMEMPDLRTRLGT